MASKKLTKQQMREDQFRDTLSEIYFGILKSIAGNVKAYAIGLGAFLVVVGGLLALWETTASKRDHVSYLLSEVIDNYNAPVEPAGSSSGRGISFTTESQRAEAVQTKLASYKKEAGDSAPLAAYYQALAKAQAGQLNEAAAALDPLTKSGAFAPVALSLRARIMEAQKSWDKAEADWKATTVITTPAWTAADGFLALGQYYERRGEAAKAEAAYQDAQKAAGPEGADDPAAKSAKTKLDQLKAKI